MSLPLALQSAIDQLTASLPLSVLTQATQEVSARYREPTRSVAALSSEQHRLAYLVTRLPATYQAIHTVLSELALRDPALVLTSLLDVGAGPGTGMWAAAELFSSLSRITPLEQNRAFMEIGQQLAIHSSQSAIASAQWMQQDMTAVTAWPDHDLVLLSYSLGELEESASLNVLRGCWQAARKGLVVIEPGTPRGYAKILRFREALIGWGARLVAPCPHARRCPMQGTQDWCHFSCRVERSSAHRQAKFGTLGYEDEKFSYVAVTRDSGQAVEERIVRHPQKRSGHVHLELCTVEGLRNTVISKKQREAYPWARKAEWGDGR